MIVGGDQQFAVILSDDDTGTGAFDFLLLNRITSAEHSEIIFHFLN